MALQSYMITLAIMAAFGCLAVQTRDLESELIQYLKNNITNFSPLARPTLDVNAPTYITMDTAMSQLVSVDSAKQSVKIGAFIQASWTEERLVWDPAQFGGLSIINWDSANIWFPVILIYNGIGDNQVMTAQLPIYLISVQPNQTRVVASWRREFEFACRFEMTRFPLDTHDCELEFFFNDQGRGNRLLIPVKKTNLPFRITGLYRENSEWRLLNATTKAERKAYKLIDGVPEVGLPTYIIHLTIQRVSEYYFLNIITPLLLLTLLQILVYFVPLESGEKLGFGITIMLSYTVFLLLLDGIVPKSQSTPAIASFITSAMILSTISLLLTSLVMRFHFAPEGTRMPACMRAVFVRFLGRLFCVSGAAAELKVSQGPSPDEPSGASVIVQKFKAEEETPTVVTAPPVVRSDWVVAAHAMERLMVALGIAATAIIIGVFVIKPYVV